MEKYVFTNTLMQISNVDLIFMPYNIKLLIHTDPTTKSNT